MKHVYLCCVAINFGCLAYSVVQCCKCCVCLLYFKKGHDYDIIVTQLSKPYNCCSKKL